MPSSTDCSRSHSNVFSPWPHEGTGCTCLGVSLWLLFHLAGRLSLQMPTTQDGVHWGKSTAHRQRSMEVASSLACSQAFPATPKGEVFPCTVRQHISSLSYKPPGQDQVCVAAGSNKRTPAWSAVGQNIYQNAESDSRLPFLSKTSIGRVASSPRCGEHLCLFDTVYSSDSLSINNSTVWRHSLVSFFLKAPQRLHPLKAMSTLTWDFPVVLDAELQWVTCKTVLPLALIFTRLFSPRCYPALHSTSLFIWHGLTHLQERGFFVFVFFNKCFKFK